MGLSGSKRISLDLPVSDFEAFDAEVKAMGMPKSERLRKALKAYRKLEAYQAQGFKIQVVRGIQTFIFADIDEIPEP